MKMLNWNKIKSIDSLFIWTVKPTPYHLIILLMDQHDIGCILIFKKF
jgi:hypothetical protein